ncbi:MAG: hypothetical protein VYD54_05120 [Bdellovibrionota bacterium]|nr:hypothetical protein [Bdellovibrionota bacterium]
MNGWLFWPILLTVFITSCLVQESDKEKFLSSKVEKQKKEDCDSGDKVIEKIKKKEAPFSLTNTEKGCSLDELGEKKLDL